MRWDGGREVDDGTKEWLSVTGVDGAVSYVQARVLACLSAYNKFAHTQRCQFWYATIGRKWVRGIPSSSLLLYF